MSKYMDMLNKQWDKSLNLATYAFNISHSSDNSNSPYFLVFGKEPLDAELKELEELHSYTGSNCGLKRLQQLKDIWKAHADNLRNIRLHKARKHNKYARELPKYLVGTKVLVRNFTRKPLEQKFLGGYKIVKVLSSNSYELSKPNGRTFKVNVNHITHYGNAKCRKSTQSPGYDPCDRILRNRKMLQALNRLMY